VKTLKNLIGTLNGRITQKSPRDKRLFWMRAGGFFHAHKQTTSESSTWSGIGSNNKNSTTTTVETTSGDSDGANASANPPGQ
jgi:hypothetical protein